MLCDAWRRRPEGTRPDAADTWTCEQARPGCSCASPPDELSAASSASSSDDDESSAASMDSSDAVAATAGAASSRATVLCPRGSAAVGVSRHGRLLPHWCRQNAICGDDGDDLGDDGGDGGGDAQTRRRPAAAGATAARVRGHCGGSQAVAVEVSAELLIGGVRLRTSDDTRRQFKSAVFQSDHTPDDPHARRDHRRAPSPRPPPPRSLDGRGAALRPAHWRARDAMDSLRVAGRGRARVKARPPLERHGRWAIEPLFDASFDDASPWRSVARNAAAKDSIALTETKRNAAANANAGRPPREG